MNHCLESSENLVHLFMAFFTFSQLFYISGVSSGAVNIPLHEKGNQCATPPQLQRWLLGRINEWILAMLSGTIDYQIPRTYSIFSYWNKTQLADYTDLLLFTLWFFKRNMTFLNGLTEKAWCVGKVSKCKSLFGSTTFH